MNDAMTIFDRAAVRCHRDRAAAGLRTHDFLFREVAERLADRLDDITRRFPLAFDLGCHDGELARILAGRGGIETLIQSDLSEAMVARAVGPRLVADEEFLPVGEACLDLVMSCLSLHWVNDLPGALLQIRRALRPDGLFLAAMLGGESLFELRDAFIAAELDIEGGASPRLSPFTDIRDAGGLLQRAGFALPIVDSDRLTVTYDDPLKLMADLRGMGESNAVCDRRRGFSRRATLVAATAAYRDRFGDEAGRVPATFEVLYLTAWAPDASQPISAKRGSGKIELGRVVGKDNGKH